MELAINQILTNALKKKDSRTLVHWSHLMHHPRETNMHCRYCWWKDKILPCQLKKMDEGRKHVQKIVRIIFNALSVTTIKGSVTFSDKLLKI